jgi:hypothetical protein
MRWWPSAPTPSGASASQTRSVQTPALCSAPAAGPAHTTVSLNDNATSQTCLAIYPPGQARVDAVLVFMPGECMQPYCIHTLGGTLICGRGHLKDALQAHAHEIRDLCLHFGKGRCLRIGKKPSWVMTWDTIVRRPSKQRQNSQMVIKWEGTPLHTSSAAPCPWQHTLISGALLARGGGWSPCAMPSRRWRTTWLLISFPMLAGMAGSQLPLQDAKINNYYFLSLYGPSCQISMGMAGLHLPLNRARHRSYCSYSTGLFLPRGKVRLQTNCL